METTIVFSGFYNSLHSGAIDDAEQQMFNDNEGLGMALYHQCDYRAVHKAYAREYAVNFAAEFKIPSLVFDELSSPREYNFTTDRIFCKISEEDVIRLRAEISENNLRHKAKRMFTSYDGFSSFYDPNVDSWGEVETWDANQVGCLLAAYADQENGDDFDQWAEYNLMEGDFGNGEPEGWLAANTPGIDRLYKVFNYLEARAAR